MKKPKPSAWDGFGKMARQEGFEPPTYRFVACCSIQLGYWRIAGEILARQEGFEPPTYRFVACCSIQLGYWRAS